MKGSSVTILIGLVVIIAVVGMLAFIFFDHSGSSSPSVSSTNSSAQVSPTIPVKDFAPNIPMSQKTTILIQTSDSSDEKYIVPTDQISTYVKSLPQGYRVVSQSP
ncbi:MAG TPA: hypothetical protein VIH86_01050 [Puia sp.]